MALEVIMPKAGIDMTEGEIVKWNKQIGEFVKQGEILLEIMTDKTNMELEAEEDGYLLAILRQPGETVAVTEIIGYLGEQGEAIPTAGGTQAAASEPVVEEKAAPVAKKENGYDVVVIGGGPAGYVAAIKASQLGGKVALVEKSELGGTCLNRGCIPTKAYLHNAEIIEGISHAAARGIMIENPKFTVDMEKVLAMKGKVVKTLVGGVGALLKSNGIEVFKGVGKITKDKNVMVDGVKELVTDKIILAGGSKVSKINVSGMDSKLVMTSDDILEMKEVPKTMAVIGGGVVGVELGQAFATFGSKVTIIEMMDRIVPSMDAEVSNALRTALEKKGITIMTSTKLQEIVETDGKLTVKLEGKQDLIVDKALLSIGRVPDLEGLGEVEFELERGKIKVDEYMETSVKGIYAPGDINGTKMLAHAAFRMGEVAAENALKGNHHVAKLDLTPAAIYTLPEVAACGLTEEQARERYDISVGKFSFTANGRAIASDENYGFVKVIADKKYGEILGVHIVGPAAAELINEASSIMEMEITVEEMLKTIHGHPTYSEVMYEAFADVLGLAVHALKKN
ncbi:dihydrolipoyl dehydrogenase [Streptobacillus moniliformis]|uniref:Dihydrolipoyl dehydrogenase n=1 Tax=Streptobacillus moniliformis (strain ATCC 14647 / DSM 12112 / NCTC 10651 / 9901) TaxID=519441 RepID=D1AVB0_STRM9|nr:dihydrolipoyl dehydrogenase [Streptobacillus moniliformis]ACZ01670.1 dihydrolipoamide dehydrogenase [Streptobacillus moniliformis DSM 12112]AVL43331.1 dihydrolipoyl dehydrogenase [Streptobacillus moniliformis]SQA13152.1 Dihydrolipoyl dehydrogenase [Streptobacillus moniliformis]